LTFENICLTKIILKFFSDAVVQSRV